MPRWPQEFCEAPTAKFRANLSRILAGFGIAEIDGPPVSTYAPVGGVEREYWCHAYDNTDDAILEWSLVGRILENPRLAVRGSTVVWRIRPEIWKRGRLFKIYARYGVLDAGKTLADHPDLMAGDQSPGRRAP